MKGCLVLQRRFAYIGHELAVLLKERNGIDEFCAYVFTRDSYNFLVKQTDIQYSDIILDEDVHKRHKTEELDYEYLRWLEKEYGNIWSFINVDRVVRHGQLIREYPHDATPYTHEEMLRIVQVTAKRIIAFLDKEKPDFLFTYQPGAVASLLLYTIAKRRGIPTITTIIPATSNLVSVSLRHDRLTWAERIFNENLNKPPEKIARYAEARQFIKEFRDKPAVYSKVYSSLIKFGKWRQFDFLFPQNLSRTARWIYRLFANWSSNAEKRTDYSTIHPFFYIIDRIKRKLRNLIGVDDLYDAYDSAKPFAYYALHLEPELPILLLAPFDTDQVAIVKRLAQSLPVGMYLYVKEHPLMTPYRPRAFYKALKKIPNVKLLRPEISSFGLMRRAALVATITGSAGWEALLLGKPVITFGEVFYNAVSSVARSSTPEKLPILVAQQLNRPVGTDEELVRFVAALFEDSAHCDILYVWENGDDREQKRKDLKGFADLIARKVNLSRGAKNAAG